MAEFNVGDTVELKSGSPDMTVTQVGQDSRTGQPSVWVQWFDTQGKPQNATFPVEAVKRTEE